MHDDRCSVCGSSLDMLYAGVQDPLTGEDFDIRRCTVCGLGHTLPRPLELHNYYPPIYYGNRHGITLRYCLRRRLGFVTSLLGPGGGRRLLDIGCGDGSFLAAAHEQGWQVAGTELNPEPARSRGFEVAPSLEQLLQTGTTFHCITTWHSLEHMPEILPVLNDIHRLLTPDGILIAAVPDAGSLPARMLGRHWLHLDVPRHLHHFNKSSIERALADTGFRIEQQWYQELEYDLMGWVQGILNLLLPTPNLFFDLITKKPVKAGTLQKLAAVALGGILAVAMLPLQFAGTLSGQGGTLIVGARPLGAEAANLPSVCKERPAP